MADNFKTYILDILSVLLPGGFLMGILAQFEGVKTRFIILFPVNDTEWINAVVYIGFAYMIGHFIYSIGSLLDEIFYEHVEKIIWKDKQLQDCAEQLKEEKTGITNYNVLNAFKWSCAYLMANQPLMHAELNRSIAESKFFRSLSVVLIIACGVFLAKQDLVLIITTIVLTMFSLIRYVTQWHKAISLAYLYVITINDKPRNQANTIDSSGKLI
jgi:hypothetical protein